MLHVLSLITFCIVIYLVKSGALSRLRYLKGKELLWKTGHQSNSASTTTTPKPLTGDDKSPPLSGQSNSDADKANIAPEEDEDKKGSYFPPLVFSSVTISERVIAFFTINNKFSDTLQYFARP